MPYYVYHDRGSCNDGSHTAELLEFVTLEEAEGWMKENEYWDAEMVLIEGHKIRTTKRQ